ncbi:hypothetical protein FB451DRAFT_1170458 [Mycena latifolia]|nr:hypothetical protein FB451DRAFT_1170458 [Mycena latifolia]
MDISDLEVKLDKYFSRVSHSISWLSNRNSDVEYREAPREHENGTKDTGGYSSFDIRPAGLQGKQAARSQELGAHGRLISDSKKCSASAKLVFKYQQIFTRCTKYREDGYEPKMKRARKKRELGEMKQERHSGWREVYKERERRNSRRRGDDRVAEERAKVKLGGGTKSAGAG